MCHDIDHHGLEIVDKVSAGIVRVDEFVCLDEALIFISGQIAGDLWCQYVVIWVVVGELLHGLEVNSQDDGSVRCRGRWFPSRCSVKRRRTR